MTCNRFVTALVCLATFVLPASALAEGSLEIGGNQDLLAATDMGVDITQSGEVITWVGAGALTITNPAGTVVAVLTTGQSYSSTQTGVHELEMTADQTGVWSVTVTRTGVPQLGRLFSLNWQFNAGSFAASAATNTSFYAIVPGGSSADTAVVQIQFEGLAGNIYQIVANQDGVNGANGRSVPTGAGNTVFIEYPMYVNPPAVATYTSVTPTISNFQFDGGNSCNNVIPAVTTGDFTFDTNVEGNYRIVCDLNTDGVFDYTSDSDVTIVGSATAGTNTASWSGVDNVGNPVPPGDYQCIVLVTVGEFHYVGIDIETSYPGFRLFELNSVFSRSGLPMFWNDADVQANAVAMPNGDISPVSSGLAGINSGSFAAATAPHGQTNSGNARAWGNFASGGKGDLAYLDTYTFLDSASTAPITVTTLTGTENGDSDGLTDYEEECIVGSNPAVDDTDGDGIPDDVEVALNGGTPSNPADTDGDGVPNVLDTDDDGDGTLTADESGADNDPTNDDADGDGTPDYLEVCSDGRASIPPIATEECDDGNGTNGDGCSTTCTVEAGYTCPAAGACTDIDECALGTDNCDANATCTNIPGAFTCACNFGYAGNGVLCAPLDSDNDGTDDVVECTNPAACEDTDGDGTPDYQDVCGDGRASVPANEACDDGNAINGDGCSDTCTVESGYDCPPSGNCTDIDECTLGTDNCDANATCSNTPGSFSCACNTGYSGNGVICTPTDTDNDGINDVDECSNFAMCEDTDGDGIPDLEDVDSDNDGIGDAEECGAAACVDSDSDGIADFRDLDSDGDGITDAAEAFAADADGDGFVDGFTDMNGDGQDDALASGTAADSDGDGTDDHLDDDADGDGLADVDEGHDTDLDGSGDTAASGIDTDGDGIDDAFDLDCAVAADCGGVIGVPAPLPDTDFDGLPNFQDVDSDADGIDDATECGPTPPCVDTDQDGTANPYDTDSDGDGVSDTIEANDVDQDGAADVTPTGTDTDGDGLDDAWDTDNGGSAPGLPNTDQDDAPNYVDVDDENDNISTEQELADAQTYGEDIDMDGVPNYLDVDSDGDGVTDLAETGFDIDMDGIPDYLDPDSAPGDEDMDGIPDVIECEGPTSSCRDTDGDGILDYQDPDDDGDGIDTSVELGDDPTMDDDVDGDGIPSYLDVDADGDGILDADECSDGSDCEDTDGDLTPDYLDTDTDGDSVPDLIEGHEGTTPSGSDADGDGLDDAFDVDAGGTAAALPDTDGDETPDWRDPDDDDDGIDTIAEDPNDDGDPTNDDTDGDGVPDYLDAINDTDSDNDGLTDVEEEAIGTDPNNPDSDNDGLEDGREVNDTMTDPLDPDTDDGGVNDGIEVIDNGTNPLDPSDDIPFVDDTNELVLQGGACSQASSPASTGFGALFLVALVALGRRRRRS